MSADRDLTLLQRLIDLDDRLAGPGVLLTEFAAQHGVSVKTIRRDCSVLASLLGVEVAGGDERPYRRRYSDRRKRLFSRSVAVAEKVGETF